MLRRRFFPFSRSLPQVKLHHPFSFTPVCFPLSNNLRFTSSKSGSHNQNNNDENQKKYFFPDVPVLPQARKAIFSMYLTFMSLVGFSGVTAVGLIELIDAFAPKGSILAAILVEPSLVWLVGSIVGAFVMLLTIFSDVKKNSTRKREIEIAIRSKKFAFISGAFFIGLLFAFSAVNQSKYDHEKMAANEKWLVYWYVNTLVAMILCSAPSLVAKTTREMHSSSAPTYVTFGFLLLAMSLGPSKTPVVKSKAPPFQQLEAEKSENKKKSVERRRRRRYDDVTSRKRVHSHGAFVSCFVHNCQHKDGGACSPSGDLWRCWCWCRGFSISSYKRIPGCESWRFRSGGLEELFQRIV
jgi:hypothetical protein